MLGVSAPDDCATWLPVPTGAHPCRPVPTVDAPAEDSRLCALDPLRSMPPPCGRQGGDRSEEGHTHHGSPRQTALCTSRTLRGSDGTIPCKRLGSGVRVESACPVLRPVYITYPNGVPYLQAGVDTCPRTHLRVPAAAVPAAWSCVQEWWCLRRGHTTAQSGVRGRGRRSRCGHRSTLRPGVAVRNARLLDAAGAAAVQPLVLARLAVRRCLLAFGLGNQQGSTLCVSTRGARMRAVGRNIISATSHGHPR